MEPLSPQDPRTIGEFELRARLGSGGMGRVYLGSSRAGRAVAVKVVRPELADDPQFKRRFTREVEAAKAVSGVYTAPVVATGLDDHPPWLATAFVPGPSLDDLVKKHGPLSEQATWRLAAGLTEALQAVHACGLMHRDLKPANVLLAADGPHVIDFGISRALEATALTASGAVVGTPGYMSPEQAEGKPVDQPTDVFSLGALLTFAATGKAPFGGGSAAAVLFRLVNAQPSLEGIASRPLRDFVASCMAKDPGKRPDLKSMAATIAERGRDGTAGSGGVSLTSFWPADVAESIRASQPDLDRLDVNPTIPAYSDKGSTRRLPAREPDRTPRAPAPVATLPAPAPAPARQPKPAGAQPREAQRPEAQRPNGQYPGGQRPGAQYPVARQPGPGLPPGYQTRRPRPPHSGPPSRPVAVTMMRTGAALSLLNMIVGLADIGALKNSVMANHPGLSPQAVGTVANLAAGGVIVGDVFGVILWLWLAGATRKGRGWPRPVGTVLFVMYTAGKLGTIGGPGFYAGKVLDVAIWIVGLIALIALWTRPRYHRGY